MRGFLSSVFSGQRYHIQGRFHCLPGDPPIEHLPPLTAPNRCYIFLTELESAQVEVRWTGRERSMRSIANACRLLLALLSGTLEETEAFLSCGEGAKE